MSRQMLSLDDAGLRGLKRRLERLGDEAARGLGERALMEGAEPIEQEARARAPVGATGIGQASIERALVEDARVPTVAVGPSVSLTASQREGFHLRFIEIGTVDRFTRDRAFRGRVHAQPFLRPAFDGRRGEAVRRVRRVLRDGLEREG